MSGHFVKRGLVFASMLGLSVISAGEATAAFTVSVGDTVKLGNGPGNVGAGEFIVKHMSNSYASEKFRTFCVQTNEFLSYDEILTIDLIADFSFSPANPITAETSALYRGFMRGMALAGSTADYLGSILGVAYVFNSTDVNNASSGELQQAIWYHQGQSLGVNNAFAVAATGLGFGGAAATSLTGASLTTYGYVQALQMEHADGTRAQDQLYWDGRGAITDVPEPASIAMWLTVAGVALVARRRRNALVA